MSSWLAGFTSRRNLPSTLSLILEKEEVPPLLLGGPFDRLSDLEWAGELLQASVASLLLEQDGQVQVRMQDQIPTPDSWSTATEM